MNTHFDHLLMYVPDLPIRKILDLGSGRGEFLLNSASRGCKIIGLEFNPSYINESKKRLITKGLQVSVLEGCGEDLPFGKGEFEFVNMAEVIEHVSDPELVMKEVYRVLDQEGQVYVSVPSRFGIKDPHYHLWFINWLPRFSSEFFLRVFERQKSYNYEAGLQGLSEMHYLTYSQAKNLFKRAGFKAEDMRVRKVMSIARNRFLKTLLLLAYLFVRPIYPVTFHFLLTKHRD